MQRMLVGGVTDPHTDDPRSPEWRLGPKVRVWGQLMCSWCMGSWLAFALTAIADLTVGVPAPVLVDGRGHPAARLR